LQGSEKTDEKGYSLFPGNTNSLLFSLKEYVPTLDKTQGVITEFVNPKYTGLLSVDDCLFFSR